MQYFSQQIMDCTIHVKYDHILLKAKHILQLTIKHVYALHNIKHILLITNHNYCSLQHITENLYQIHVELAHNKMPVELFITKYIYCL